MSAGAFLLASGLWQNGKAGLGFRWTSGWTRCPECRRHAVDMQPVPSLCEAGRRVSKDIEGGDIGPQNSWKSLLRCTMLMFPSLSFCHHLAPTFIVKIFRSLIIRESFRGHSGDPKTTWLGAFLFHGWEHAAESLSNIGTETPTSPQEVDVTLEPFWKNQPCRISVYICMIMYIYICKI